MSIARLIPVVLCSAALFGCEGTSEPEYNVPDAEVSDLQAEDIQSENPFVGTWKLTSAVLGSDELLPGPFFSYIVTYWGDGTHSVSVSGDVDNLVCPDGTSCSWRGNYIYTGTSITTIEPEHPDPEEQGEDTAFYTFCSNKLFFMDEGDGDGLRLTLERARRDCYVRECD